jgi:hypothetical protein
MRSRVAFTGKYHCPTCWIEEDLTNEESLICEECGEMLVCGPLRNPALAPCTNTEPPRPPVREERAPNLDDADDEPQS